MVWRKVYAFGDHERDRWIADQARSIPPGSRVLDVGAGPCRYGPLFAHCHYETQDFCAHEPTRFGSMNEVGTWSYGKIDYVCDAASIPVEDASFDAVICTEVLEHVAEPIRIVNELARILRPQGKLILTAPLGSGLHQEPDHYYGGFTPYWYRRFLGAAGFENIEVFPNGGFFKHYGQESQRFSALLDPRRVSFPMNLLVLPLWLLTIPLMRIVAPPVCALLDSLDDHRAFTVGYHVLAVRNGVEAVR